MITFLYPAEIDPPAHEVPLAGTFAKLGFPSPAEDFLEDGVDLHRLLVRNAPATYLYKAEGDSMTGMGIYDGDILVVDRSVVPQSGDVVLAIWDGQQPACKTLILNDQGVILRSANALIPDIYLTSDTEVELFAVVGVARQLNRSNYVRAR